MKASRKDRPDAKPGSALDRVYDAMLAAGSTWHGGNAWTCPTHDDQNPSFAIDPRRDGRGVVIICSKCGKDALDEHLEDLGLTRDDLLDDAGGTRTTFVYKDEAGTPILEVVRFDPVFGKKQFKQRPYGGSFMDGVKDVRPLLLNLPTVREAIDSGYDEPIYVVEGEKGVKLLAEREVLATTNSMGGGNWHEEHTQQIAGAKRVVIVADRDQKGYKHALAVARAIKPVVGSVVVKRSRTDGYKDDIEEHLASGGSLENLEEIKAKELRELAESDEGQIVEIGPRSERADGSKDSDSDSGTSPPVVESGEFSDVKLADRVVSEAFKDRLVWTAGLGWLKYDGKRWKPCTDVSVTELVRRYFLDWFNAEVKAGCSDERRGKLSQLLAKGKVDRVVALAKGPAEEDSSKFDALPDLLNTPSGVVDLRTAKLLPHDPKYRLTKIARAPYIPGAAHPDWDKAKEALPPDSMDYLLARFGQAITGHATTEDVVGFLHGSGENGKSSIFAPIVAALGGYARQVSDRVLMSKNDQPTELMDLRGVRFAYMEELPESHLLNVQRLKKITGTPEITARELYKSSTTFSATHSLFVSTNFVPRVTETDHGTWRRLELIKFPYTYRKPSEGAAGEFERAGEPGLRERLIAGADGQHEAALAELVEHARRWYERGKVQRPPSAEVVRDTREWRNAEDVLAGYFEDNLIEDAGRYVIFEELVHDFNGMLLSKNKQPWDIRTVSDRMDGNGNLPSFEKKRIRSSKKGLSRPGSADGTPLPAQVTALLGLAFTESGV